MIQTISLSLSRHLTIPYNHLCSLRYTTISHPCHAVRYTTTIISSCHDRPRECPLTTQWSSPSSSRAAERSKWTVSPRYTRPPALASFVLLPPFLRFSFLSLPSFLPSSLPLPSLPPSLSLPPNLEHHPITHLSHFTLLTHPPTHPPTLFVPSFCTPITHPPTLFLPPCCTPGRRGDGVRHPRARGERRRAFGRCHFDASHTDGELADTHVIADVDYRL